jgi:hypothetical protein
MAPQRPLSRHPRLTNQRVLSRHRRLTIQRAYSRDGEESFFHGVAFALPLSLLLWLVIVWTIYFAT